jgi:hypothetical protein
MVQGGLIFGVIHPEPGSLFAGQIIKLNPEQAPGGRQDLSSKRAMVYALPGIKLCWTGRDWAISYPLDNPQK